MDEKRKEQMAVEYLCHLEATKRCMSDNYVAYHALRYSRIRADVWM